MAVVEFTQEGPNRLSSVVASVVAVAILSKGSVLVVSGTAAGDESSETATVSREVERGLVSK